MSQKIFDNDLISTGKSKLNQSLTNQDMLGCACSIWVNSWCMNSIMIILKINMITNQDYYSLMLILWRMKLKLKLFMNNFYLLIFSLLVGKTKEERADLPIKELVRLKTKIYFFLIDDSNENTKAKVVNKNFVSSTSQNEYKDVLLSKNCIRHSMNRKS